MFDIEYPKEIGFMYLHTDTTGFKEYNTPIKISKKIRYDFYMLLEDQGEEGYYLCVIKGIDTPTDKSVGFLSAKSFAVYF